MKYCLISRSLLAIGLVAVSVACNKIDDFGGDAICCKVVGTQDTKATLVTSDNLASQYSTMTVAALKSGATQPVFSEDFTTPSGSASVELKNQWKDPQYTFYSYPMDQISPQYTTGNLVFSKTVSANSTDTPDLVVAAKSVEKGNTVELLYKHIFTAVNVIYATPNIGHRVTNVSITGTYKTGTCTVTSGGAISWSNLSNSGTLSDTQTTGVTYKNQEITVNGRKFMTIPGQQINLSVTIDGKTITKSCEAKQAGDIVNFYIDDNCGITTTNGVVTSGKVEKNTNNTYKMTLESYVTGQYSAGSEFPDFILVLDNSSSMTRDIAGIKDYQNNLTSEKAKENARIHILKTAAKSFINLLKEDTDATGKTHKVAIVSFGKPEYPGGSAPACANYVNPNSSTYLQETPITSSNTGTLTQVLKSWTTDMNAVISSIESLDAKGNNTAAGYGMDLAVQLLSTKGGNSATSIIFFTDGQPENQGGATSWSQTMTGHEQKVSNINSSRISVANHTVASALQCKNMGCEVYSIGIFSSDAETCTRYCQAVSSEYPNAKGAFKGTTTSKLDDDSSSPTYAGTKRTDGKKYFFLAKNANDLKNAFTKIFASASCDIHGDSYMKAIVSDAFTLPSNYSNVQFYTAEQNGYNPISFGTTLTTLTSEKSATRTGNKDITWNIDEGTKTLKILGFDYAANFCKTTSTGSNGKKLVIVFDGLTKNPNIPANTTNETIVYTTGLYKPDGTLISSINPGSENMKVKY